MTAGKLLLAAEGTSWDEASKSPVESRGLDPSWASQFPLRASGRHVVNARGERFRLRGANWYGASDALHVVGGLDTQRLEVICQTIHEIGFNVVRLPFSNEMLRSEVGAGAIDFAKNPELKGLRALEVFDEVVHCLGRHSVAVILNNHTTYGEWCGGPDRNGLWFDPASREYTEARWLEDWTMLAARYRKCPQVVGFDLRNEVRFCPWPFRWPSWGGMLSRLVGGVDWASASARCAERVIAQNPALLIVVERVIWPMRSLKPYAAEEGYLLPRFKDHLVLGVHHYSWNGPGRYLAFGHLMEEGWKRHARGVLRWLGVFSKENYGDMHREQLMQELTAQWGALLESSTCPVWVSEFGTGLDGYDMQWFQRFVECLGDLDADWAYWPLNVGPKPGCGGGEPYGMLAPDWTPKAAGDRRLDLLRAHGLLPSCR